MLSDEWLSRYGLLENFNTSVTLTRTRTGPGTWTTGVTAIALCTSCSQAKNKLQMAPELVYQNEAIGTPVTFYSTLELSERVLVLGLTPRNLRDNPGGAAKGNRSSPGCHFRPRNETI